MMRIDNALPTFYTRVPQTPSLERYSAPLTPAELDPLQAAGRVSSPGQTGALSRPGVIVDISPEGWAAYAKSEARIGAAGKNEALEFKECETCKSRTYQDVSDDPSVSFQTPTHISPNQAGAQVMAHESEHVSHEQARADHDGRKVISQSVTLQSSICPECGRVYISGGVTKTVTAEDGKSDPPARADGSDPI